MAETSTTKKKARPSGRTGWIIALLIFLMVAAGAGWWAWTLNSAGSPSRQQSGLITTPGISPSNALTVATGPSKSPSQPVLAYGVVTAAQLNLRLEASTASLTLGTLRRGDIVPLVRRSGGWYQTSEGGWLSALHLEVRQTKPEAESYARELNTA